MRVRYRQLHALIRSDGTPEHHPLARVGRSPFDEEPRIAYRLGRDQDPLHVPRVDDVPEALALFTDQVLGGHLQIVEEELVRMAIERHIYRLNRESVSRFTHIYHEDGQPLGLVAQLVVGCRARQQQHQVGLRHP